MEDAQIRNVWRMRFAWAFFGTVAALVFLVLVQVFRRPDVPVDVLQENHAAVPLVAAAVLTVIFLAAIFTRNVKIRLGRGFPWLVGCVSLAAAFVPWFFTASGRADLAMGAYRGLQVPQGWVQFWDLSATFQQIDCAGQGFNVSDVSNGCAGGFMYGPGILWFHILPVLLSDHVVTLGVLAMVLSSLMLVWLARSTPGVGQIVLLIAAIGAPWQLLLERGNIEAVLLWVACATIILVRRWNRLLPWAIAAAAIWFVGTWKFYPFALGVMLVPVLRLRRGWTVLVSFVVAVTLFILVQWEALQFSSAQNEQITFLGDWVALGRVPVVVRMIGGEVGTGLGALDLILFALGFVSVAWGVAVGLCSSRRLMHPSMLAASGSCTFLAVVLVGGFGWAHKATFLLLCIPLVAELTRSPRPVLVAPASASLMLIAVASFVVVNPVLATLAGVVAAGFSLGLAGLFLARSLAALSPSGLLKMST